MIARVIREQSGDRTQHQCCACRACDARIAVHRSPHRMTSGSRTPERFPSPCKVPSHSLQSPESMWRYSMTIGSPHALLHCVSRMLCRVISTIELAHLRRPAREPLFLLRLRLDCLVSAMGLAMGDGCEGKAARCWPQCNNSALRHSRWALETHHWRRAGARPGPISLSYHHCSPTFRAP